MARYLALIDGSLRFALFGLECALSVEFSVTEVERVFRDSKADQVSAKEYVLCESGNLRVSGLVDAYEPESIWIHVEGSRIEQADLEGLFERARNQALRFEGVANRA